MDKDTYTQSALSCDNPLAKGCTTKCYVMKQSCQICSFGVQETEYVKPDFIWEFHCHL